ncbi:Abi family protein [Jeotgalicoccus sp. FSL K6-3177]|uniref:Abi family protein n=1 Tax=Jeotgalicoccus sp. FSL K6-3177 TaxID=2921494 RepID=UPI0030FDEE8C
MKPFKTIDQQIDILKSRNMKFHDEESAKYMLSNIAYYSLINGYKRVFCIEGDNGEDDFQGNYFEDMLQLYDFDKRLSGILFIYLSRIEETLKNTIAYQISNHHGSLEKEYIKESIFKKGDRKYYYNNGVKKYEYDNVKLVKIMKSAIQSDETPIVHYKNKHNNVPPWILVKHLSLGNLLMMYKLSNVKIKDNIIENFFRNDLTIGEKERQLFSNCFKIITHYRNKVAHGYRVYNHNCRIEIDKHAVLNYLDTTFYNEQLYLSGFGKKGLSSVLFSVIIMSSKRNTVRSNFISEIENLFNNLKKDNPDLHKKVIDELDFPSDYNDILSYCLWYK